MRVHQYLDNWAREQTDAEFAVQGKQRLTYGEAAAAVNRLGRGIVHSGIEAGERVGFLARNRPECVLLYLAGSKAGVVMVPLNPDQTPNQWAYALNDSKIRLLFCAGLGERGGDRERTEIRRTVVAQHDRHMGCAL